MTRLRVDWVGTFDPGFTRNKRLSMLLDRAGVDLGIVRMDLWPDDRIAGLNRKPLILLRMLVVYPMLTLRLLTRPAPDVYLVGYPGWFDMIVVGVVARIRRVPIVFDPFISLYDTVVESRQLVEKGSFYGSLMRRLDAMSIRAANRVLTDSHPHIDLFSEISGCSKEMFTFLAVGADETVFKPAPGPGPNDGHVLYYGTYLPLHGTQTIVRAAALTSDYKFLLVGAGQDRESAEELATELGLSNVTFLDRIPQEGLMDAIDQAGVCLGQFGATEKADRVNAQKIYEVMSVGRPIVTRSSSALERDGLTGGVKAVNPNDEQDLSAAIRLLMADPEERSRLALAGHSIFIEEYSTNVLSEKLAGVLAAAADKN